MKKQNLKKFLIGTLIALQLNSAIDYNNIKTVYAHETHESDNIYLEENGKILLQIGLKIDNYEYITFGYHFKKDGYDYMKDALTGKTYNLSKMAKFINCPEIIYTKAINVLPDEIKKKGYLTKQEGHDFLNGFSIADDFIMTSVDFDSYELHFETFAKGNFDNENLPISNRVYHVDTEFTMFPVTEEYDEEKESFNPEANNFKLGIYEDSEKISPCFTNIYEDTPFKYDGKMGIIIRYYAFDKDGNYLKSLYTQEQIDEFIKEHKDNINEYSWKVAYYTGSNIDELLTLIDNNELVPSENTTYFKEYKPLNLTQKKPKIN